MGAGLATSISREHPDFSAQPILAVTANILEPNNFVGPLLWDLSPIGPPEIRHLLGSPLHSTHCPISNPTNGLEAIKSQALHRN
jgi:hypothetical protein